MALRPAAVPQVARRFMKAKTVQRYWAVDRAIGMWDGPIFWRRQGGAYWNHNFFMVQSDEKEVGLGRIVTLC